jgi:predicted glutamine amidotransferase
MCRFTLYVGPPIRLGTLLCDQDHSLVQQSAHSDEREDPLNGDGFGVGWYNRELSSEPAVFRSVTPAWNNRNFANLARILSSDCILAHVRAATQSSGVNEANCHPFRFGRYAFAHNGDVGSFARVRRRMLASVSDQAFSNVFGSTDSEHVFALFIDELARAGELDPARRLGRALDAAIARTVEVVAAHGGGEPSYLNLAVTDGDCAAASRFSNNPEGEPESLYVATTSVAGLTSVAARKTGDAREELGVIVSSERLDGHVDWTPVPPNHVVLVRRGQEPAFMPCTAGAARQAA